VKTSKGSLKLKTVLATAKLRKHIHKNKDEREIELR
jgi:hypothetical protein